MPVETICTGCGKRLRVSDEHAGKLARCPQCQTTYTVPAAAAATGMPSQPLVNMSATVDRWQLRTSDGLTYGPIAKAELDRWLAEGRVTPQSQILQEGAGQWRGAAEIYPQLAAASATPDKSNPFADQPATQNPYAGPSLAAAYPATAYAPSYSSYDPATGSYLAPHRGVMVLILGILGLTFCGLLGIPALAMGLHDLREIGAHRMDPSGRGLTLAGTILAGIALGFMALTILFIGGSIVADF